MGYTVNTAPVVVVPVILSGFPPNAFVPVVVVYKEAAIAEVPTR
jgi:hypothetical protein